MSAQFEKGDFSIEPEPNTRLVDAIGHKWHRTEGCRRWHNDSVRRSECLTWVDLREHHGPLTMADGSTTPATEPEDKDDLYVEPEPLKAGEFVLIWAQMGATTDEGRLWVTIPGTERFNPTANIPVSLDAIVRPDAGQVPPWVKPARCTSLYDSATGNSLMRCEGEAGHQAYHVVGWVTWTDAVEYGRVVESGGAS